MSRVIATVLAGLILLIANHAGAEAGRLAEAQRLVERQDFDDAREVLDQLLQSGELNPDETRAVYRGLAECHAALRHPSDAREAYILLLLLDPDHYVPTDASPLVRDPFEQALAFWDERGRASLDWSPPARVSPDTTLVINLDLPVDAAPTLLARSELLLRSFPGGEVETFELEGGRLEIGPERLEGVERLELSFSLFDEQGNTVARIGTPEEPIDVTVSASESGGDNSNVSNRRLYQRWWFWAILGVVIVGAGVAIPVGLSGGSNGDPCTEALGGPCDLAVTF